MLMKPFTLQSTILKPGQNLWHKQVLIGRHSWFTCLLEKHKELDIPPALMLLMHMLLKMCISFMFPLWTSRLHFFTCRKHMDQIWGFNSRWCFSFYVLLHEDLRRPPSFLLLTFQLTLFKLSLLWMADSDWSAHLLSAVFNRGYM